MPTDPLAPQSWWARLKHAVKVIAVLLGIAVVTLALLVLAWTSMNLGTFICFGLVVVWIVYHERVHYLQWDSLAVAEKRILALEEYAGIRRAYEDEWKTSSGLGGHLADYIHWPRGDDLARWRREHWRTWSARYDELAANPVRDATAPVWDDGLGPWSRELDDLWDQRPYLPPPESDDHDVAYWRNRERWEPKREGRRLSHPGGS